MVYQYAKITDADLFENKILVADNTLMNRELITSYLKSAGYRRVMTATDGPDTIHKVKSFQPNLLILDSSLSDTNGAQIIKELRESPCTKKLPILMQTTVANHEERNEAWKNGATDVIMKPTHKLELLARVKVQLQNGAMIQQLENYQAVADQEIAKALELQISLLPSAEQIQALERKYGISVRSLYLPSRFLSGDMWGMHEVGENRVMVWICDFSGKGIGASLHTLRIHTLISELKSDFKDSKTLLRVLNFRLVDMIKIGNFCTFLIGILDFTKNSFDYVAASSTHPILYRPEQQEYTLGDGSGIPIGIEQKINFTERSLPFTKGDALLLYSDLMWEDEGAIPGISFAPEALPQFFAELKGKSVMDVVTQQIELLGETNFSDDLTLIEIGF